MSLDDELREILGKGEAATPQEAMKLMAELIANYHKALIDAGIPERLAEELTISMQKEFLATGLRK